MLELGALHVKQIGECAPSSAAAWAASQTMPHPRDDLAVAADG
jgi:hypothetical protein